MSLVVENLALTYDKTVFEGLGFTLDNGQIACLLGASGCGKTSVLRCLLGLATPKTGRIVLDGAVLFDETINIPAHKRGMGMVFQDYALFPHLTVAQNIAFGLNKVSDADQRVKELLAMMDLQTLAKRYPHELSGGQQQRVALARSLAPKPKFILLDEPFSNLDSSLRQSLSLQIKDLLNAQGVGAILVTHDQSEAFAMADTVGVMAEGRLCQWDSPYGLYHQPQSRAVAGLIGEGVFVEQGFEGVFARYAKAGEKVLFVRPEAVRLEKHIDNTAADKETDSVAVIVRTKHFGEGVWHYELTTQDGTRLLAKSVQSWEIGTPLNAHIEHAIGLV